MNVLSNPAAEKAVLSACYNGGVDVYYNVADIIRPSTFVENVNELFFSCIKHAYEVTKVKRCELAAFQSAAIDLGIDKVINKTAVSQHIKQIMDFKVNVSNAREFAKKIRKLEIARLLHSELERASNDLLTIDGTESVNQIIGIAEKSVFNFASLINDKDDDPEPITNGLIDRLNELKDNPVQQPGISTGFPLFDAAIGGGLRGGTVNMIGARAKGFKSGLALNMGRNIAKLNVPVLYLDTEMRMEDQQPRLIASQSKVKIRDIETGAFGQHDSVVSHVYESANELLDNCNQFYYKNISGFSFEEQLSVMRRWIFKTVGVNTDKQANPCVIVYDYLKLMDTEGLNKLAEHQLIGFLTTQLHNFSVAHDIPILSFVQLNRDGLDKESVATVSQSDRIIWLCSNFSILKPKSPEEIVNDGEQYGNYKLAPLVCRHGPGMPPGEYISCQAMRGEAFIKEIDTSINIRERKKLEEEVEDVV